MSIWNVFSRENWFTRRRRLSRSKRRQRRELLQRSRIKPFLGWGSSFTIHLTPTPPQQQRMLRTMDRDWFIFSCVQGVDSNLAFFWLLRFRQNALPSFSRDLIATDLFLLAGKNETKTWNQNIKKHGSQSLTLSLALSLFLSQSLSLSLWVYLSSFYHDTHSTILRVGFSYHFR